MATPTTSLSYAKLYDVLMRSTALSASAKLVLTLLVNLQRGGITDPKIETLAAKTGLSRSTVDRALRQLRELKLLSITWGDRQSSYTLAKPEDWSELLIRQNDVSEPAADTSNRRHVIRQNDVSGGSPPYLLQRNSLKSGETHHTREKVGAKSKPAAAVAVCVPPLEEQRKELAAVLAVFSDFGRGCSAADAKRCERDWTKLSAADRQAVGVHLRDSIPGWRSRPTSKIPHPWNYLEGRYWERDIPRRQPQREMDRREQLRQRLASQFGSWGTRR